MSSSSGKGNLVSLKTFESWGKNDIFGHKVTVVEGREMVNFMWCKLCAKYKKEISQHLKGVALASALAMANGTNFVAKHSVNRHLDPAKGKAHNYALSLERRSDSSPILESRTAEPKPPKQTSIIDTSRAAMEAAHKKLLRTAYHLAMTPTMPLSHFEVLVKVQRSNGVRLIQGKHDDRSAKEYISALMTSVEEKCAVILGSKNFMTILSDGSQARKTGAEKEMVLIRLERNGLPCYIVASLLEMEDWGGSGAEALKAGIDDIFSVGSLKVDDYRTKLVGCTADGASVNFGKNNGLLKRLDDDRGWLIKIHCANHRIELALKDAFKESSFSVIDQTYMALYSLCKNSGKIKSEIKAAAEARGIEFYVLTKLSGTRFVGHRINAFKALINTYPAVITALENVIADSKTKQDVRGKVKGLLKKFLSHDFLIKLCFYLDLLEAVRPASKIFEDESLMIFDVRKTINETILELKDMINFELDDDISSHFRRFSNLDEVKYFAPGDGKKKKINRKYHIVDLSIIKSGSDTIERNFETKKNVATAIKEFIETRFEKDYNDPILRSMDWFDVNNWEEEKEYGYDKLRNLSKHFKEPLEKAGYDEENVIKEWNKIRRHILAHFTKKNSARQIWEKILLTIRDEFPNICLLAELIITFSGSNSTVERAFSLLSNMLSNRRLSTSHKTMNMLLKLKICDNLWNNNERELIMDRALEIFLSKRRRTTCFSEDEPCSKKPRVEISDDARYGKDDCEWFEVSDSNSESESD